jgi:YbbR domain-containing protein
MSDKKSFWQNKIWQAPGFIGYKVSAIIIAVLIWGYVIVTQNPLADTMFTVPLEVRNLSSELAVMETTDQVQVRVQGNNSELENLKSGDISAYVDLSGAIIGSATLEVKVEVPADIEVVSVTPASISVEISQLASGTYPLEIRVSGEPAENYLLLDAVASPNEITISGAEDYLQNVGSVIVSANVSGLDENLNKNLQVEVLDNNGNNISEHFTISPRVVSVLIPVVYDLPEKSIAINPSVIGTPASGYQVSRIVVEPSTVRAFGDLDVLDDIYYLETEPIDINGMKKTYTQTVEIIHSEDVSLAADTVTVVVQIEPISSANFSRELVYSQNLLATLKCVMPDVEIDIKVSGPETVIDAMTANDIVPYVDCSGIKEPGQYTLPLQVTLPANVSLVSIYPEEITITIEVIE